MSAGLVRAGRCAVLFAAASVPLFLVHNGAPFGPGRSPAFRDVRELQGWAERRGLYCRSDRKDDKVVFTLAVATRPLTWEQVNSHALRPPGPAVDHAWQGVVWAINRPANAANMAAPPWFGECRAWGGVLVTGDRSFLDQLERAAP
jgi:hypothetical protein